MSNMPRIITDPSVPRDEVQVRSEDGALLGKIVGLAPNVCIITQAGREVARVPVVEVEERPGEYRYQLPPMELGSYLVNLVYEPLEKP